MRAFVLVSLCVALPAALSSDTYPRQLAIDVVHYRFALAFADGTPGVAGQATVTVKLVAPAPEVVLDLISIDGGKGMRVSRVESAGKPVTFSHQSDRLRLPIPSDSTIGQEVSFTIAYAGVPAAGLHFTKNMHGAPVIFSENWPNKIRNWLPMLDHPYDKATGEFIVTAPAHYQVVSNGVLIEELDLPDGQRRTHWKQSVPIASWLYSLGIAHFAVHHAGSTAGVPLQTWVFPQDRTTGRALFEETSRQAMQLFSERIGPYPYEKLANVQAVGFSGGMENATVIFYGEKGVASGRGPVVHEIAHQWFGNSVTERDWDDVWLSEGFATYFTLLFNEHYEGRDAFVAGLRRSRTTIIELERKLPNTPIVHRNLHDMERVLNQFVYQKGGWVLHMLRREIGTDAFWSGIRDYYRRYRDQNASSDDLRQVMEKVSGKDLRWLFTQWLNRSGVPKVEGSWRFDPARKTIELTLSQTHAGDPFRMNVDIGVTTASGSRTERVALDQRTRTFSIANDTAPTSLTIDPETWLLAEIQPVRQVP